MTPNTTILVVDDDSFHLLAVKDILSTAEYQVRTTNDGTEALKILEEHTIHLILADIAMPGMNGYQLFNEVTQNPLWVNIPFVFLTGRSLDTDVQFGKELGVDDYLTKPITSGDLLATIRGKLKRAKARQQSIVDNHLQNVAGNSSMNLEYGMIRINLINHQVWINDNLAQLSALEFRLLAKLAQQPGRVIPHQILVRATHQLETDSQDASRLLRPLVRSLRRKLGYPAGNMGCIENLRGVGYQFNPLVS